MIIAIMKFGHVLFCPLTRTTKSSSISLLDFVMARNGNLTEANVIIPKIMTDRYLKDLQYEAKRGCRPRLEGITDLVEFNGQHGPTRLVFDNTGRCIKREESEAKCMVHKSWTPPCTFLKSPKPSMCLPYTYQPQLSVIPPCLSGQPPPLNKSQEPEEALGKTKLEDVATNTLAAI